MVSPIDTDTQSARPVLTEKQLRTIRGVLKVYRRTGSRLEFATITVRDLLLDIEKSNAALATQDDMPASPAPQPPPPRVVP